MSNTGRIYKIYNTANIDKIYVGSTKETLTRRWQCHKSHAKSGRTSKIYEYIRACNYENFRIVLLEEVKYNDKSQLREVEDRYINQLRPELNSNNAILNLEKVKQEQARYQKSEKGKQAQARYYQKKKQARLTAQAAAQLQTQAEQIQV